MRRSVVYLSVAIVAAACGAEADPPSSSATVVRDSAGLRIVENAAPDPAARLPWTVADGPSLSIGTVGGDPALELFGVEDALRLDDGTILVSNAGTSEVRRYAADGNPLGAWGGEGEGPGEFRGLTELAPWPGDSIMAWDFSLNRLTVFDQESGGHRIQRLTQGEGVGAGRFEGILPDGSIVTASLLSFRPGDNASGLVRRSRVFARVSPEGELLSELGRHEDEEYWVRNDVGAIVRHPFRRSVHSEIWDGRIVITPSDRYEIRAFEPDGTLTLIARRAHNLVPVSQADVDAWVDDRVARVAPEARAAITQVMEGMTAVESYPAFSQLIADEVGDLWVREYDTDESATPVWTVFDRDGVMRGRVETPAGLSIYRIGRGYVLGRSVDDLGIERVELWDLRRGEG